MSNMLKIHPIPAFNDNYIWCIHNDQYAYVVDPGDHQPVVDFLSEQNLNLSGILITHHHADHIGGVQALIEFSAAQNNSTLPIWGPNTARFPFVTHPVVEQDEFVLEKVGVTFLVMEVPGHTLDHIAYHADIGLFCGDTMFSAGCGRLFEGDAEQMQTNFDRFRALPDTLSVYCTHEYTLANIAFAQAVWSTNKTLDKYSNWATEQRAKGFPTLPSTIAIEKNINPFMNTGASDLRDVLAQQFNEPMTSDVAAFAALRKWKDTF